MKFTENEKNIFNEVFEHAKSGNVPFNEVVIGMIAYSNDTNEPMGLIKAKAKNPYDLKEYDFYGVLEEDDDLEYSDAASFVAVEQDGQPSEIYLYGGDDPTAVVCKY